MLSLVLSIIVIVSLTQSMEGIITLLIFMMLIKQEFKDFNKNWERFYV